MKAKYQLPLMILKGFRRVWWGSDPDVLIMLYKSFVRSRLEYGGFLISPCKESRFYELQKVQNKAIRLSLG